MVSGQAGDRAAALGLPPPLLDLEGLRNPVDLWLAGCGANHPVWRRKISTPAEVLPRWKTGVEAEVAMEGDLRAWMFPSALSGSGHIANLSHLHARIGKAGGAKFWYHSLRNCFITVAERDLLLAPCTYPAAGEPRADITEDYTPPTGPLGSCASRRRESPRPHRRTVGRVRTGGRDAIAARAAEPDYAHLIRGWSETHFPGVVCFIDLRSTSSPVKGQCPIISGRITTGWEKLNESVRETGKHYPT